MRWIRPARLPILISWMVIIGVVIWFAANPRYVAPYASRAVSHYLLGMESGGLRVRDYRVRMFEGVDLYGVSLNVPGSDGSMTLASADTVVVDFAIGEVLSDQVKIRRMLISRPEVYSRAGTDTTKSDAPPGTIALSLPKVLIEHLMITDAYLEFSNREGRLSERISRLNWRGEVRADETLSLVLRGCEVFWDTHDSHLEHLRGQVVISSTDILATEVYGHLNGNLVRATGHRSWAKDLNLHVQSQGVSVAEVEDLIDQGIGFSAVGDLDATFVKANDAVVFDGVFTGALEGYQVTDLHANVHVTDDTVTLDDLVGGINGASFDGGGIFDIANADAVTFVLEGQVRDVDLTRGLIPGEDDLPATNGHGRLRIAHSVEPLWTHVTGTLAGGHIDIVPFDTCFVDVEAVGDTVYFHRLEVLYEDLQAQVQGHADTNAVFAGTVHATSENLVTLPDDWQWPDLGGRLYGQGQVRGPLDALEFAGWLSVYDFQMEDVASEYAEVDLVIDDVLGDPVISAGVDGLGLRLDTVPLGDYLLWGMVSSQGARVDSFRTVLGDSSVALRLNVAFGDSVDTYLVDEFEVDLEGTRWRIAAPVTFDLGADAFSLSQMSLLSDQGALHAEGRFLRHDRVSGRVDLQDFDLGLFDPFIRTTEPLTGKMTAQATVRGLADAPVVQFEGDLVHAPFALATIDTLHVAGDVSGGAVSFRDLDLLSNFGRITGKGEIAHPGVRLAEFWNGAELDLDLEIIDGDWAFLDQFQIPALDRLAGRVSGNLHVAGRTDDPLVQGRLHSSPFHVHWLHLDTLDGVIWADHEEFVLADLKGNKNSLTLEGRIELPMELDFLSEPVTPPQGPFFMQLEIPQGSDLEPLARATNAFVTCSGTGGADVIISGPLEHPYYQGTLSIDDAGFVLRNMQEIYYETSCDGEFSGDDLHIRNIRGREGLRGRLNGDGTLRFKGLELESFDIGLKLDRFLLASIPDLAVVVSSDDGRMSSVRVGPDSVLVPRFTGSMEVIKARYTGDFSEKGGSNDPLQATVAPDWMSDLRLHAAPRSARIVNQELELYAGGDLNLIRNEQGLYLRGSLDVNSGRLMVFNNSFEVQRGRLDFSREVGFDPRIDLDAETRYRLRSQYSSNTILEHIGVHLTGTLSQPEVSFSSERGYSRDAIQRMLLGLEPHSNDSSDYDRLRMSGLTAGFNVLEREIARELDIVDTFEIDQIQRQRQTQGGEEVLLDPLIGVGKYIGSDLYLKYAQGVRQDDRDILVEYQINDHLLLQSEIRRRFDENQGQPTYNLDLKYRFEY